MNAWITMGPLLSLVVGGMAVMIADAFVKEKAELAVPTCVTFIVGGGFALALHISGAQPVVPEVVSAYLAVDDMALYLDIVICAGAALTALLSGAYLQEHGLERGEYYVTLIFSVFGAMVLARATDLLSLFIGLETMSLGAYCLIAFRRTSGRAQEAAVKYFLLGSFAAAILLFGSALLYGATGTTSLEGIAEGIVAITQADDAAGKYELVLLGMVLVLVGLAFKISAVPFHMWTPDAYEGAATPVTTFMAIVIKTAAFGILVRVLLRAFGDPLSMDGATGWPPVLAGLAALTMVFGNLAAIVQTSVKRMLAYSSIAHAGYLLVGVVSAFRVGETAVSSVLYYLLAYTVSNALAFGALIWVGSKGKEAVSYEDLAGVGRRHPLVAIPFVLGILSLMGFPPTAGFFGKYYVFYAAVEAGGGMIWLAVIGVVSSAIGAYYYLRVLVFMFMKEPAAGAPKAVPMKSWYIVAAMVISGYFVLRMGIAPSAYIDLALEAARDLLA